MLAAVMLRLLVCLVAACPWQFAAAQPQVHGEPQAQVEPQAHGAEVTLHQIDHPVRSEPGETIRIVNPYGNVRVRAIPDAAPGSLRITIQSSDGGRAPALVDSSQSDEGPVYEISSQRPQSLLRVDVVVALPDRAGIDVRLTDGDFTMHPARYPVRVRADSGAVTVRTLGEVDVRVWSGHLTYNPPSGGAPAGGRLQSSGAPVDVLMKGAGPLAFRVLSGAAVTTDSLPLLRTRAISGRAVSFGADPEAETLEIRTDHGPVRLVFEGHR